MKVSVIGAGLGGLLAGAALSKGHDVDVYERLDIYGGRFTNLPYNGFQLTTALHHDTSRPHRPAGRPPESGGRGREDRPDQPHGLLHDEGQ